MATICDGSLLRREVSGVSPRILRAFHNKFKLKTAPQSFVWLRLRNDVESTLSDLIQQVTFAFEGFLHFPSDKSKALGGLSVSHDSTFYIP